MTIQQSRILDIKTTPLNARRSALAMIYSAGSGHPGGSLSCIDILVCLAGQELGWNNWNGTAENKLVLSKGHACPALYAVAAEYGLLDKEQLPSFRKLNSLLQGHPHALALPWVETSTGSLGQGFSAALGMALGLRYQKRTQRVYVVLGDGEIQEGQVWETAMCAAHHKLSNLCAILDYNKMQSDDLNANIMGLEPVGAKWRAFNWNVIEADGHDMPSLQASLVLARHETSRPTLIIAHTIKGKGVSYMEASPLWHGSVTLRPEEFERAMRDLDTPEADIEAYKRWRA